MPTYLADAHGGHAIRPRVGEATPPHSYKPLGLLAVEIVLAPWQVFA
jgi:hypothetical protein